ncbi:MAG: right-handed parallel beta-helix repeat-containing protein [Candidatus Cloacimonetes bacterium]|nr:right-handed parallel beta-helix repeat-containing protein [Candidatus Cloacimonadota bacterium]
MKKTFIGIILLVVCWGLMGETHVEGGAVDGFWVISGSPYMIDGDIFINDSETLTIQSGVEVIFSDNYELNVSGRLLAAGAYMDSILWSVADTTGFSNTEIPDGGWGGIRFDYLCDDNEMSELSYCVLEYGKAVGELDIEITGGAVFVDSCSNVMISNCRLTNNIAVWGGAIGCNNGASPTISHNIITHNLTYNFTNHNGCGAGIFYNSDSSPLIEANLIADNIAEDNGGGICAFYGSNPSIIDNLIRDNVTEEGGGIILGTNGMATISGNVITGNTASFDGGGICFSGAIYGVVENNYIAENSSLWGGGLSFFKSYNVDVIDNIMEYNTATLGGGVSDTEEFNFDIALAGNSIRYNTSSTLGGGILWSCNGLSINSENLNSVYNNSARVGDDLYIMNIEETVCLDTFTVLNPTSAHVYPVNALEFEIANSIYDQVDADVYVSPEGDNANSGLSAEEALQTVDQAIRIINPGDTERTVHLGAGTYSGANSGEVFPIMGVNNVNIMGAGAGETILDAESNNNHFYFSRIDNVVLSGFTIINANPENGMYWPVYRGSIYLDDSDVRLEDMAISDNYGGYVGGGLNLVNNSLCELDNVKISHNTADTGGGAIYCGSNSEVRLTECEITGNQVEIDWEYAGAAICCVDSSKAVLINCTLADNYALAGGSICIDGNSTMTMVNSISRNDSPAEIYIGQEADFDQPVVLAYCNLQGGSAGIETPEGGQYEWLDGNIDAEPLFVDPEAGDYELMIDSPCVDSGIDWFEWNEEVLVDLAEEDYYGVAPDMGCYEYGNVNTDEFKIDNVKLKINAYPNPFNPETTISFSITTSLRGTTTWQAEGTEKAEISIYNIKGQRLRKWNIENVKSKINQVVWDGRNENGRLVSSGVYLVRLQSEKASAMKKIMLIK